MAWHATFPTALGVAAVIWHEAGLVGFELPQESEQALGACLARRGGSKPAGDIPDLVAGVIARAQSHCAGVMQDFSDLRFDWSYVGAFQREVYRHTLAIQPGTTRSYGEVARAMGLPPASARAIGGALGSNPWPLLVPCHRVVAASGKVTGFSAPGGISAKTRLLALEGAELRLE